MSISKRNLFLIKILIYVAVLGLGVFLFIPQTNFIWTTIFKNSANFAKILAVCGYLLIIVGILLRIFIKSKNIEGFTISLIVLLAFMKAVYNYNSELDEATVSAGPYIIIGIAYIIGILSMFSKKKTVAIDINIRDMVEIAMFCALAIVLDLTFFKIRIGQNGGSISLVMLPLAFMCIRQGFFKGLLGCGIVFGFLSCLIDGYGIVTYPLDYLGAFGSMAIVGLFRTFNFSRFRFTIQEILLAALFIAAVSLRLLFATLSGVILYDTPFVGSLAYNASYVLPSAGFSLVALLVLHKPISKLFVRKTN